MAETTDGKLPYELEEALTQTGEAKGLTEAETARLRVIAAGLTYEEMADQHCLRANTVKTQVAAVLGKLGARSRLRIEAAVMAGLFISEHGATKRELYEFLLENNTC